MNKIKILFLYKAYPMTIANYFRRALERRQDVELFTAGEFYGQWIPWAGGMTISMKYPNQVNLPLPQNVNLINYRSIEPFLPWKPDLILNVDAGFHLSAKPDIPYFVVATDPHVLENWYAEVRPFADRFFNMQPAYMQKGDILLPYAFDPTVHYPVDTVSKNYDCAIIGIHYPQRDEWVARLRAKDISVNYRIGDIYDEYREENNKAWIGLNWSSLEDVTARVFEIMAMKLVPVTNRLSALNVLGFTDNQHYLGFSSMEEAVEKVIWAKNNPVSAKQIAQNANRFVNEMNMTYDSRIQQILEVFNGEI